VVLHVRHCRHPRRTVAVRAAAAAVGGTDTRAASDARLAAASNAAHGLLLVLRPGAVGAAVGGNTAAHAVSCGVGVVAWAVSDNVQQRIAACVGRSEWGADAALDGGGGGAACRCSQCGATACIARMRGVAATAGKGQLWGQLATHICHHAGRDHGHVRVAVAGAVQHVSRGCRRSCAGGREVMPVRAIRALAASIGRRGERLVVRR
jgi:hypothetical protein